MAAVELTISGMLYDKLARTQQNVVLIGEAFLTGYAPGHPLPPEGPGKPPGGGGDGKPPGTWGGSGEPFPTPPIANVPGVPGWTPPDKPPEPVQPPVEWKAVWVPTEGWVVVGIPNFPHPTPSEGQS